MKERETSDGHLELIKSMNNAQQQAKDFNAQQAFPVTLVEHMTDPRAAQLQMLYATLDESGRRAAVALLIALVKLQKEAT